MSNVFLVRPFERYRGPVQAGDFILTHGGNGYSKAVRLGEKIRFRGALRPYAYWSHAAFVTGVTRRNNDGEPVPELAEATCRGVHSTPLSKYDGVEYHYVRVTDTMLSPDDRRQAAAFVRRQLGTRYGWGTILSILLSLTLRVRLQFGRSGTFICSGLVARALERGYFVPGQNQDAGHMTPGDLAALFGIVPAGYYPGMHPREVTQ